MSQSETVIMDSVLTGQPINLAGMMIWYMAEAGSKKRSTLPYGMILTMAFKSQGVVISDSEPMKNLRHTDYYSLATVHRMGFVKVDGRWERKGLLDERAADIGATASSGAGPSVRHPSPEPTDHHHHRHLLQFLHLEQLKELFGIHEERMKIDLDSRLLSIKEMCYSLEDKIRSIESSLGSSSEALKTELMQIFEKIKDIGGDSDIYSKCNAELQEKIIVASAFIDRRLNEFIKIQSEGMGKILEELKRLLRF